MSDCKGWKITAIISLSLVVLLLSLITLGMFLVAEDEKNENVCYSKYMTQEKAYDYYYDVESSICYLADEFDTIYYAEVLE